MNSMDVGIASLLTLLILSLAIIELVIFTNHLANSARIIRAQRDAILESDRVMTEFMVLDVEKNTKIEGHLDRDRINAKGTCHWNGRTCLARRQRSWKPGERETGIVRVAIVGGDVVWLVF